MKHLSLFLFLSALLSSQVACKSMKKPTTESPSDNRTKISASLQSSNDTKPSDSFTIAAVRVEENTLFVEVSYGGGCKKHRFECIGATSISKSLPPIRSVQITHFGDNDMCKALVYETIEIDISALAYQQKKGSEIILNLTGWEEPIHYTFH